MPRRQILRPPRGGRSCFGLPKLKICYIDESGCTGSLPHATSNVQPVLVVSGLFLDRDRLADITRDFLALKARLFPKYKPASKTTTRSHHLDRMLQEVKGAEVRKHAAASSRRKSRHAIGLLDQLVRLLVRYDARFVSRVWIKPIGGDFRGASRYPLSIQDICSSFQNYLEQINDSGIVVADSRFPAQNRNVAHSIFTQKFQLAGDPYHRIAEMPTFGDSQNHAGLQICDLLTSAVIEPLAVKAYCEGHVTSIHVRSGYSQLQRFTTPLRGLQHRYREPTGRWRGGVTVSDGIGKRSGKLFFDPGP